MTRSVRHNSPPVRIYRYVRTCVHVSAGVATTLLVFPLVSPHRRRALVKRWSVRLLRILAVEAQVRGDLARHEGNVLVVANHISWLDIFVLNSVHPVRFVAKSELAEWPVVGAMIRGAGTLFIQRAQRRDTHRVNHTVAKVLSDGDVVAIFPRAPRPKAMICCRSRVRSCSPSSKRRGMSSRLPSAIAGRTVRCR